MPQRARLVAASVFVVAAFSFLGYRMYDYHRDRPREPQVAEDPIVLQARALYVRGSRSEALALLSRAHREDPQNHDVALEYVSVLYTTQNYEAAEGAASDALAADPTFTRMLGLRGMIRRDGGKLEQGIADLEAAVAADPDEAVFVYSLASALLLRSSRELGLTAAAQADIDRAAQLLQRAAELEPLNPEILSDLAFVQTRRSQWLAAIEVYRRLAKMLPQEAGPLASAAECYLESGDAARAAAMARAAVERDPQYAPGHEQLARALRKLPAESVDADEYKQALRSWWDQSRAATSVPALWLAEAHIREENLEAAEAVLRESLADEEERRHPPDPEAHDLLARVLRDSAREEEAELELAVARRLHDQWDPAGDLISRITARPEQSRGDRLKLARLYQELGWPDLGLPYLKPMLNADPPDAEAEELARELRDATP
ncbi:MAG: tetratricopeptide repeat protein [Armatimonadota bacterium]